jgi:DNA helicase-2/ATP-dependent DNA helicase PcrA
VFYADLHIHSKYSRATSRDCDLEHLAVWAARKGIGLLGTGDFTHPAWREEIRQKLIPAEPGLFRLRPEVEATINGGVSHVRFILQVEISTIYKKDGRTRKVHHLLYVPDLAAAERLVQSLARIGNLNSDGRPILGLDSRHLLEITLESGPGAFLIPAHIWTPWFAVLGSMSGFDAIEHCYGDLSGEVFALETGLSSDPPMNWRLSSLDRYALVSNSDAHSPSKLGREACVFDTPLDYFALRQALATGQGYGGTVEFFPEEGKYHLDGHRKCEVCLEPEESIRLGDKCPACGKPLTLGVMHRVCQLADRPEQPERPPRAASFRSLIPLAEVLSEICGTGPDTKTVRQKYDELLVRLGPELEILDRVPLEDITRQSSLLGEALRRMRAGQVIRQAGFDGEYGVIRLFTHEELLQRGSAGLLFEMPEESKPKQRKKRQPADPPAAAADAAPVSHPPAESNGLDPEQQQAAEIVDGAVLIVAGPGTGKTRVLTQRLARLVSGCGVAPEQCLAITFSRRAAAEMQERLERLLPDVAQRLPIMTFHALGLSILRENVERLGWTSALRVASLAERVELLAGAMSITAAAAEKMLERISRGRRTSGTRLAALTPGPSPASGRGEEGAVYRREMRARGWVDFDDLVELPVALLRGSAELVAEYRSRYRYVSVDEYQDIDPAQYELLRLLVPADGNVFAIGDPDQAIYGFRGADVGSFQRFRDDYPGARTIVLGRNYRSSQTIVDAALQLVAPASLVSGRRLEALPCGPEQIEIHACATERAEAELVVHTIERMLGGSTFFSLDTRRAAGHEAAGFSFADFAVLYRTEAQAEALVEAFERSGMPFQCRSHKRLAEAERPPDDPTLALCTDVDLWDPRADRVSLLTLHASKGLEFGVVFIVGCEDGLLPLRFGPIDGAELDEERRLFFVGMTRAREHLVLTHARRRLWRGQVRPCEPSPMLEDIYRELLARHEHRAQRKPAPSDRQQTLF